MFNTIADCLANQAKRHSDKAYLIFPERRQTLTYHQLWQGCCSVAAWLKHLGVGSGDRVAIWLPNIPEFCLAYWGPMLLGAVSCPVNTLLTGSEAAYIIHHCEAAVLIMSNAYLETLRAVRNQLTHVKHILIVEETLPNEPLGGNPINNEILSGYVLFADHAAYSMADNPVLDGLHSDSEAMMIYTSGTTGKPKGVVLTHKNLLANAFSIAHWFHLDEQFCWMNVLPLFHVNGEVVTLMTPLATGGSVVLNRKFSASRFWTTIENYKVNGVSVVPTLLSMLLASHPPAAAPSSLKFILCGAAPLPVSVHQQFEQTFHVPVIEGYGLSETTCFATFNPPDKRRKYGSIGVAVDCEVRIWDDQGHPTPPGQPGEIVIAGANVMSGYFKNPDATRAAFAGEFFHSGDWGRMDEDGYVYILDRVKDMIIRGGENIYPREVDEVLYRHPAVADAATIGIPDALYGEAVQSYVVVREGHAVTENTLLLYCRQHLATFKCPQAIVFVTNIPKGPTGKLLRRALRTTDYPPGQKPGG